MKKIIHVDMDAFFASVEQRDEPSYRGKPLVVGGSPDKRGAVAAASYEAREFGIHSAMSSRVACLKCKDLIVVPPRFEVYREVSQQIRDTFSRYTDLIEPLALDEAYLDVTQNKQAIPSATWVAQEIKQSIFAATGLTASAGVSYNKFLAKVASGKNKPDGLCLIPPHEAEAFVEQLPIDKFYGIGKVTPLKMHKLGVKVGADLKKLSLAQLTQQFGKHGYIYYQMARAQDQRQVEPYRVRKSIGAETTFEQDLANPELVIQELEKIAVVVNQRLDQNQSYGRTLTLKIKYADYQQITRSITVPQQIQSVAQMIRLAKELVATTEVDHKKVRLLGIAISNLASEPEIANTQLALNFENLL